MSDQGSNAAGDPDELANDIVGVEQYAVSVPAKKSFLPWHRPRKQFVRHEQWRYQIGQLLDEGHFTGTLTYFGLPGVDLLDLRYFGTSICEPRDLKLRFLGFNKAADPESEDQAELNISFDELSKSPSFDPQSEIVPDDLRQLVNENSIAWQKTLELGPYDIVNLDLCDGFGAQQPDAISETYYSAVTKLLAVQVRKKSPWLLLLTTRVGKSHVHAETLERLSKLYGANLKNCRSFLEESIKAFAISDAASLQRAKKTSVGIQSVFLVGICKWLLGFAIGQTPPSKFEVKSVYGYRVLKAAEVEDMISIAFRFDPTHEPLPDASRLASIRPMKIDECELATKALIKVGKLFDVDEYLASVQSVRDEMIEAMCSLLEAARYDVDEYRKWVAASP
jgi:hypothetical protein